MEVATATTSGEYHRSGATLRNSQDALGATFNSDGLIAVPLSDGCGSLPHSEFGAEQTVQVLGALIREHAETGASFNEDTFTWMYKRLVASLYAVAAVLARKGSIEDVLTSHMMATAGAMIITSETTWLIGAGDFVGYINGEPFAWKAEGGKDKPLYPALSRRFTGDPRFKFRCHSIPTPDVQSLVLGTDGLEYLESACRAGEMIPGTNTKVGQIRDLWTTDKFFESGSALPTWLSSIAGNYVVEGPEGLHGGLLHDDTTLVVVRRKVTIDQ